MTPARRPRIIFFSGLAADHHLLEPQRALDAEIVVPAWIEPQPNESLASYGRRISGTFDGDEGSFLLGGVSFGALVAEEVARHRRPAGLILLAACRSGQQLPLIHRALGPVAPSVPHWIVSALQAAAPIVRRQFGIVTEDQRRIFDAMLKGVAPDFVRWSVRATIDWPGVDSESRGIPVLHIHGNRDRIIPLRPSMRVDYVIDGAGHVVNLTHADEVNHVIRRWISNLPSRVLPPRL